MIILYYIFVENNKIMETILSIIIGAVLGAFLSYAIYVWFTILNLKKYLRHVIKSKLQQKRDVNFYSKYHLSEITFLKIEIDDINKKWDEVYYNRYKLIGRPDKYYINIQNKLRYILIDIYRIEETIKLKYPSISDGRKIQIENTFNATNIINDIRLKSSDNEIQKLLDIYPMNGVKVNSFKLLE